jgi:uncharacterized protein (TIGR00297 family)
MIDLQRIFIALLCSGIIGGLACWRNSLTIGGWLGAVIVGTATLGFGGWSWGLAVVVFFVTSSMLSRYKQRLKEAQAGEKFEKGGQRDFAQTMANGGIAALLALLAALFGAPPFLLAVFTGVIATVTADTWATELGVLSKGTPRLITTGQPVEPGTSGGITLTGTLAEVAGALLIGATLLVVTAIESEALLWWLIPAAAIGGVVGAMYDSLLGATVQALYHTAEGKETEKAAAPDGTPHQRVRGWRWLNNDLVNMASSLVGGAAAVIVWWLVAG